MKQSAYIGIAILVLVIQILISNLVDICFYVNIMILPYILIAAPKWDSMLRNAVTGFIVGILFDILSNGITGLCAAAMTVLGIFRNLFLPGQSKANDEPICHPSVWSLGASRFFYYALACNFVFFVTYIPLEYMGRTDSILLGTLRALSGIILNTLLVYAISALTTSKQQ